jgi:hypothetical protein
VKHAGGGGHDEGVLAGMAMAACLGMGESEERERERGKRKEEAVGSTSWKGKTVFSRGV